MVAGTKAKGGSTTCQAEEKGSEGQVSRIKPLGNLIFLFFYEWSQQISEIVEKKKQILYNEVAHNAQDLGAGPFERFDSSPEQRRKIQTRKKSKSSSSTPNSAMFSKKVAKPPEKVLRHKFPKETGSNTGEQFTVN